MTDSSSHVGTPGKKVEDTMHKGYAMCLDWLTRAGLKAEPDKMELIFFRKLRECIEPPKSIYLLLLTANTYRVIGFEYHEILVFLL